MNRKFVVNDDQSTVIRIDINELLGFLKQFQEDNCDQKPKNVSSQVALSEADASDLFKRARAKVNAAYLSPKTNEELVPSSVIARRLGTTRWNISHLAKQARNGKGDFPHYFFGKKTIRDSWSEVLAWLEKNARGSNINVISTS